MSRLEPGQKIKTTTVMEALPDNPTEAKEVKDKRPPFFEYIDTLTAEEWQTHDLHVYRSNNGSADRGSFQSLVKYIGEPLDGFVLRQRLGGGTFKFLLKNNGVIIKNEIVRFDGAPKDADAIVNAANAPAAPAANSGIGVVADGSTMGQFRQLLREVLSEMRGGPTTDEAFKNALSLQSDALRSGLQASASVLGGLAQPPRDNPTNDLMNKFMMMMLERAMNPPNPIQSVVEMATALKGAGIFGSGGGDRTNIGLELVRQLPSLTSSLTEAVGAWARVEEMKTQAQMSMAGKMPPPPAGRVVTMPPPAPGVAANGAPVPPMPPPAATPNPTPGESSPVLDAVENGIVNIMLRMREEPVADMVEEVIIFLDGFRGMNLVDQLSGLGEENLWKFFQQRVILREVPQDQRLKEFLRVFVMRAKEPAAPPPPPAPKPPATKTGPN